jgi:nitrous oxidase accessory protein NosD
MKRTIVSYMVATIVSLAAIGALSMQPISIMAQPESTAAACGMLVKGNVTLTSNLNCNGDGLIVEDDGSTINLNGYSITGPGAHSNKVAIMVPNTDDVKIVGPGSLRNFQAGVLITGSDNVEVSSLILQDNEIAVFMTGTGGTRIDENVIKDNTLGTAAHSGKGVIISNDLFSGNRLAGVTFVNTARSEVSMNNIQGSENGVFLDTQSRDNTITHNNAFKNTLDLNNGNGLAPNINSNNYQDNNCERSNPSGLCIGR